MRKYYSDYNYIHHLQLDPDPLLRFFFANWVTFENAIFDMAEFSQKSKFLAFRNPLQLRSVL